MDLRGHLTVLRNGAPVILGMTSVAIVVAIALSLLLPRVYESRATLYVGQGLNESQLDYGGLLASQILTQTYARLATTGPVTKAVIQDQHLQVTSEDLQADISTEVPLDGTLLVIVARNNDSEIAAGIANSIANQLMALAPKDDPAAAADREAQLARLETAISRIEGEMDVLLDLPVPSDAQNARLGDLEQRLGPLQQARSALLQESTAGSPNALTLVDPATASSTPVAPSRVFIVAGSAAIALALSILVAYLINALRSPRPTTRRAD